MAEAKAFCRLLDVGELTAPLHFEVHQEAILREMVIKALRSEPPKFSLRRKRRRAALDPGFRLQLLSRLHAQALDTPSFLPQSRLKKLFL